MSDAGSEYAPISCSGTPRIQQLSTLLALLPDYGIVICKSCQFAVQPKAFSSHLLRHHIYRDKRQRLLDQVAKLALPDPDQVPLPIAKVLAFPHLPVASGYRCEFPLCGHLCISHKRMSQHLREHHGCVNVTEVNSNAQRTYLQTFFRGNKVRYFEVKSRNGVVSNNSSQGPSQLRFFQPTQRNQDDGTLPTSLTNYGSQTINEAPGTQIPTETLLYLHHYTTVTGESLTRGAEPATWWTHTLPLQISAQPFLMHGILGVAAFHRALVASDPDERRRHHSAGLLHQSAGLATFRSTVDRPTQEISTALIAFARLLGVQSCAQALLEDEDSLPQVNTFENSRVSKILEVFSLLRGGLELLLSIQDLLPAGSGLILSADVLHGLEDLEFSPDALVDQALYLANEFCTRLTWSEGSSLPNGCAFRLKTLTGVRQLMKLCISVSEKTNAQPITDSLIIDAIPEVIRSVDDVQHLTRILTESHQAAELFCGQPRLDYHTAFQPPLLCYPHIPTATYTRLVSLPSRLLARVARPHSRDIRAFDHAMAALISCFSRSYAMDAVWARWNGIESWPRMLSDYFLDMIKASNPIALVLVAHWCFLLSMQENHYWFLRGQSQRILKIVLENLDVDMQVFIKDCVSSLS